MPYNIDRSSFYSLPGTELSFPQTQGKRFSLWDTFFFSLCHSHEAVCRVHIIKRNSSLLLFFYFFHLGVRPTLVDWSPLLRGHFRRGQLWERQRGVEEGGPFIVLCSCRVSWQVDCGRTTSSVYICICTHIYILYIYVNWQEACLLREKGSEKKHTHTSRQHKTCSASVGGELGQQRHYRGSCTVGLIYMQPFLPPFFCLYHHVHVYPRLKQSVSVYEWSQCVLLLESTPPT